MIDYETSKRVMDLSNFVMHNNYERAAELAGKICQEITNFTETHKPK